MLRRTSIAMTPSCERILARLESFQPGMDVSGAGHLVLALLMEESLGSKCLNNLGITLGSVADGCLGEATARTATHFIDCDDVSIAVLPFCSSSEKDTPADDLPWCRNILERAQGLARRANRGLQSRTGVEISSEDLLLAMVDLEGPIRELLKEVGVTMKTVMVELESGSPVEDSLAVDFELVTDDSLPAADVMSTNIEPEFTAYVAEDRLLALIDANLNRSREGLRVLEDYARFILRDVAATSELKNLRHDLVAAELAFRSECPNAIRQRDTDADVGTGLTTQAEMQRENLTDITVANARRVQEALRSLEEFGKTLGGEFAASIKQLRYRSYAVEQTLIPVDAMEATEWQAVRRHRRAQLQAARLYVLVTEKLCAAPWQEVVREALSGGADVIQLREKELDDQELIGRGRWLAEACEESGALFIMNDRIDIAVACGAHGVHLGQNDGSVAEARSQLRADQLLGVSTHDTHQLSAAMADAADYLGVGPVFESQTKSFSDFPGLDLVDAASSSVSVPWFPIGGIGRDNLKMVMEAGAVRVAVCGAVIGERRPASAAREIRAQLTRRNIPDPACIKLRRQ